MNEKTLAKICAELASELTGQKFGKIFSLARFRLAVDFRLPNGKYLFISVEPSAPRLYLIARRLRDLEKQSKNSSPFVLLLRSRLAHAVLQKIEKLDNERVIRFAFSAQNEIGAIESYTLVSQLTGRSANLFLLDENDFVLDALRENSGEGQEIAHKYAPPFREEETRRRGDEEIFSQGEFSTLPKSTS